MANSTVADCGREACDTMPVRLHGMIVRHTFYAEDQSGADDRRRPARPGRPTRVPAAVPESQPGIEAALADKLHRLARTRLASEAAKLNPAQEKRLADEGLVDALDSWPE